MPAINIDFTGASAGGGDGTVLDPGIYPAVIKSVKLSDKAGQSGYKYFRVAFEVGEDKTYASSIWSLSPGALWRMKTDLVRLGIEVPDGQFEFDPDEPVGMECMVKIINETDNGTTYNNVEEIVSPDYAGADSGDSVGWE